MKLLKLLQDDLKVFSEGAFITSLKEQIKPLVEMDSLSKRITPIIEKNVEMLKEFEKRMDKNMKDISSELDQTVNSETSSLEGKLMTIKVKYDCDNELISSEIDKENRLFIVTIETCEDCVEQQLVYKKSKRMETFFIQEGFDLDNIKQKYIEDEKVMQFSFNCLPVNN